MADRPFTVAAGGSPNDPTTADSNRIHLNTIIWRSHSVESTFRASAARSDARDESNEEEVTALLSTWTRKSMGLVLTDDHGVQSTSETHHKSSHFNHSNGQIGSASHVSEIPDQGGDECPEVSVTNGSPHIPSSGTVQLTRAPGVLDGDDADDVEQGYLNKMSGNSNVIEPLKVSTASAGSSLCRESGPLDPRTP